jgi:uncharacterized protein with HEPN domain
MESSHACVPASTEIWCRYERRQPRPSARRPGRDRRRQPAHPRGPLTDGLVFDAVRARLIEIGEAVKDIDEGLLANQPQIPWREIAGMRDQLAHRYFDTSHAIVGETVRSDIPQLEVAVESLLEGLAPSDPAEKRELLDRVLDEELPRHKDALRRLR